MNETSRQRLARYMEDRRDELAMTWDRVAQIGSTHAETLRQVRVGDRHIRDGTKRAIEIGLRWERGSVDAILAGGEPSEAAGPRPALPAGDDAAATLRDIAQVVRSKFSDSSVRRTVLGLIELWERSQAERAVDHPAEPDRRLDAG